jgi:hypothetical protein
LLPVEDQFLPSGAKYPARVTERDLTALKPHPGNPRIHTEEQIQQLCRFLAKFGYAKISIAVQASTDLIMAGHGVVEALLRMGITKVLVYEVDLPDSLALAFMLADNKSQEMSSWDTDLLPDLLFDIAELPDVELEDTGFAEDELAALMVDDEPSNQREGDGDFHDPEQDSFVNFSFGSYSGRVADDIYQSFVEKYQQIQEDYDDIMLDDVLRRWLNV